MLEGRLVRMMAKMRAMMKVPNMIEERPVSMKQGMKQNHQRKMNRQQGKHKHLFGIELAIGCIGVADCIGCIEQHRNCMLVRMVEQFVRQMNGWQEVQILRGCFLRTMEVELDQLASSIVR